MDGKTPRSLIVTVCALVLAIGAIGIGVASAQVTGDTFTGCLKGGTLTKVAIGSEPVSPCVRFEILKFADTQRQPPSEFG